MPDLDLTIAPSIEALPPDWLALFPPGPLAGVSWYRTIAAHAVPSGATACYAMLSEGGQRCGLVPLLRSSDGRGLDGLRLSGLTTPYTCVQVPLLVPPEATPTQLQAAARRLGRFCRDFAVVRFDAIPPEWRGLADFAAGLRQSGLFVQRFAHFGNWHEPILGRSWAAYLAGRPGALRETVRRKLKRCEREARFELFADPGGLDRGIAAFETVYRASWKQPEPYPRFNAALMRATAQAGALRLGVLWTTQGGTEERPAAAQFWVLDAGRATVLKLAHDEACKALSPGTALTAMMVRHLLDEEAVCDLDFGRGDDPYKALWATERRKRIGLLLANPWRPAGLAAIGRGVFGRLRAHLARVPHDGDAATSSDRHPEQRQ